jgi:hypothetical protein
VSTLEGDFWVCGECRSINNARAKQCYNCRTPRDLAAVDPMEIEGTGHGRLREIALPPYHSSRQYAVLASILILAIAGLQVVLTVGTTTLLLQVLDGTDATAAQLAYIGMVGLIALGVGVAALVAWSLWLSRAVTSMPALGLGYPAASGMMAFVENFLPGLNLLRVPAIVRDVVRRLEPGSTAGQTRGEALIFAAWIGLLGGFVVPRVGAVLSGFSSDSTASVIRSNLTIGGISMGLVLVGAIFLVALIWWIEERIDRRREAQLAEIDAKVAGANGDRSDGVDEPAPPAPVAAAPVQAAASTAAVPDATPARVAEVPASWSWGGSTASPLAAPSPAIPATQSIPDAHLAAGWERAPMPRSEPGSESEDEGRQAWAGWPPGAAEAPAETPPAAPDLVAEPVAADPVVADAAPPTVPEQTAEPAPPPSIPEPAVEPLVAEPPFPAAPPPVEAQEAPAPVLDDGPPHLTIRVARMGMLEAEMAGETEPVILEDLSTLGAALADAGGTAEIVVSSDDSMAQLIAKRAQRILADTGIEAALPG